MRLKCVTLLGQVQKHINELKWRKKKQTRLKKAIGSWLGVKNVPVLWNLNPSPVTLANVDKENCIAISTVTLSLKEDESDVRIENKSNLAKWKWYINGLF